MALFGAGSPKNLEQVLGMQADTATMGIEDQYARKRKRTIDQQAHAGRLGSGVSDYTFADLDAAELGDISGVASDLSGALGRIPAEDYGRIQEDARKRQLAILLAEQMQPSDLEEAFGAIGGAGQLASTAAGLFG